MIPKIIYQTWYTKTIPQNIQKSIQNMMILNDEYEYKLFDDEDMYQYIVDNFEDEVIEAFDMLRVGAAKADLWRYLILYKDGGVYLDIDSSIFGKLDDLIREDDSAIITRERNPNKFVQWCLMFESNHPILKICINKCLDNIKNKRYDDILKLTGPDVFSESIFEYCKSLNLNPFWVEDDYINKILNENNLKFRLYKFDFENFCQFKHELSNELYTKPDWREEQKMGVFKK